MLLKKRFFLVIFFKETKKHATAISKEVEHKTMGAHCRGTIARETQKIQQWLKRWLMCCVMAATRRIVCNILKFVCTRDICYVTVRPPNKHHYHG